MFVWLFIGVLGIAFIIGAAREQRRLRVISNAATVRCADVAGRATATDGLCEVAGTTEPGPDGVLEAPLSGLPCVWYRVRILDRPRQRFGGNFVRLATPVLDVSSPAAFGLRDGSGRVRVVPENAHVEAGRPALVETEPVVLVDGEPEPGTFGGSARPVLGPEVRLRPGGRYKYHEWLLPPGSPVYVLGRAALDPETGEPVIRRPESGPFLIGAGTEAEVVARIRRNVLRAYGCGGVMVVVTFGILITNVTLLLLD
ncbi:GIDE domain-containing protein [Actinomadura scrupuli]|uniref:GIDE domain-containing protein n=1 Tax=Actinomadura scrupuli TaxID=559629 RepID=UPI003D953F29